MSQGKGGREERRDCCACEPYTHHSPQSIYSYAVSKNFMSLQCFQHLVLTCHTGILQIYAFMDFTAVGQALTLNKLGSDCLEKLFRDIAGHGAFKSNVRNCTFFQFVQRIGKILASYFIQGAGKGQLKVKTSHQKQEFVSLPVVRF